MGRVQESVSSDLRPPSPRLRPPTTGSLSAVLATSRSPDSRGSLPAITSHSLSPRLSGSSLSLSRDASSFSGGLNPSFGGCFCAAVTSRYLIM